MPQINKPRRLTIVRHGESTRNMIKKAVYYTNDERILMNGTPNHLIELTDYGKAQALQTGLHFWGEHAEPFDYIYHSGFVRTKQTAFEIIHAFPEDYRTKVQMREDLSLCERNAGYCYNMTKPDVQHHYPWFDEYWEMTGPYFGTPVGGESAWNMTQRVRAFIHDTLYRKRKGQNVLIVTHSGVIKCFRALLERWDLETIHKIWTQKDEEPINCGVTVYEYDGIERAMKLKAFNEVYWNGRVKEVTA